MKTRNKLFAKLINKIFKIYWFIVRPKTRGVKAIISNNSNKILMVRLTYYPDTWTFPGGGVNKQETHKEAVIREVKEEVGIDLIDPKLLDELFFDFEYKKDTVYIYSDKIYSDDVKIDKKEVAEAKWFVLNNLPQMGDNSKKILNVYLDNIENNNI